MARPTEIEDVPVASMLPASARRLWSRQEFERAGELGLFGPEERLELIDGEVIRKVTPQKSPHATGVSLGATALGAACGPGHHVRVQLPLALGPRSEPEPDLCVVSGQPRDYAASHPSRAALVVEVADTTLTLDRTLKAGLYAEAGVIEYWIVNLVDRVLEVHREPSAMAGQPFGHHYRSITRHTEQEVVSPLVATGSDVKVADLLP
jgi:Uma2 family endonuclease